MKKNVIFKDQERIDVFRKRERERERIDVDF